MGRLSSTTIRVAAALALGAPATAWADHTTGAPAPGAGLGLGWLLVLGGVLAVALGAWALLAPDRDDEGGRPPRGEEP